MSEAEAPGRHDAIQGEIVHVYDGIEEADNQLPLWWVVGFLFTVAFSLAYWLGHEVYDAAPGPLDAYQVRSAELAEARAAAAANAPAVSEALLVALSQSPATVAEGAGIFKANCLACHGERAEGKIGPNLTDDRWLHGGAPLEIHKLVEEGFVAKGMPAWGPVLGKDAVRKVTAFVLSVRDTHVPGKAAEGEPYSP